MNTKIVALILLTVVVVEAIVAGYIYTSLSGNITLLVAENKQLRNWLASNVSRVVELEESLRELSAEYSELSSEHQKTLSEYQELLGEYTSLRENYAQLQATVNELNASLIELGGKYRELQGSYEALNEKYQKLQATYTALQLNYTALIDKHYSLYFEAIELNSTLANLANTLTSLAIIPQAFKRVLNLDSVKATAPYVFRANVKASDAWTSIQNIYYWIRLNVRYTYDVPITVPTRVTCNSTYGFCTYEFDMINNYVQEPEFTAKYGQGDCDDQAVLAYAMIKYYMIYVHGKEYGLWLAHIELSDGSGHLAVFLPVQSGKLTIVDPAGAYLTSIAGIIAANTAYDELVKYSNYWSSYGGIKKITLYDVNVYTGDYRVVIEGDIGKIASFIAQ